MTDAMPVGDRPVPLVVASPLDPALVDVIRAVDDRLEVMFDPELLAVPQHASDHLGVFRPLTREQDARWHDMLARAEVSFDFDRREPGSFARSSPNLRWIQAASAGLGQALQQYELDLSKVTVTSAAGVHAEPLSEFVIAALLYFVKDIPGLLQKKRERDWTRHTSRTLYGRRVAVVGTGAIGSRTIAKLQFLGVETVAVGRPPRPDEPARPERITTDRLVEVAPELDALVLTLPLTPATEGLIDAELIAALRPGCIVVNVARGKVIDEPALIEALQAGHLGGAALDVAWHEPLLPESPLWSLGNVLISPHSAAMAADQNARIVEIFCDNLRRYLDGRPLRNVYDPRRGY
jgi:phosphoglycerate dehydrogenase-like enzyme